MHDLQRSLIPTNQERNSIGVTVGMLPSSSPTTMTVQSGTMLMEVLEEKGWVDKGFQVQVNGTLIHDFNIPLQNEDVVILMKKIRGNA